MKYFWFALYTLCELYLSSLSRLIPGPQKLVKYTIMANHDLNRLVGNLMQKKFEKIFRKLFFLMYEIFDRVPYEYHLRKCYENKPFDLSY